MRRHLYAETQSASTTSHLTRRRKTGYGKNHFPRCNYVMALIFTLLFFYIWFMYPVLAPAAGGKATVALL